MLTGRAEQVSCQLSAEDVAVASGVKQQQS